MNMQYISEWKEFDIESKLPLPYVITLAGFFFVCIMEETIHYFLIPHGQITDSDTFMGSCQDLEVKGKCQVRINSTLNRKRQLSLSVPTFPPNEIHLEEFTTYDQRHSAIPLYVSQDSPPPSYSSQPSVTEEMSYESKIHRQSNEEIAMIPESKLTNI